MKSLLNIALDVISSDEKRNRLMENLEAMDQSNSQSEIADDLERLATTTKDGHKEALEVT
jgi:UDP-N-acetylglucosamine:LPS N-acetylglucosamine transferase